MYIARLIASGGLLCALASSARAQAGYPTVAVDYLPMFDAACADATGEPVEPGAVEQLLEQLSRLRAFWVQEQATLLPAVTDVTGLPFRFGEARAALFLCRGFPSMSLPLLINARSYVAATAGGATAPLVDFSNVMLHELLHRFVGDCLAELPAGTTPLLQKYRDEPAGVRNHLHLYAIEQLIYEKLEREDDLAMIMVQEQRFPRAWAVAPRARAIVAIETAAAVVRDLAGPDQLAFCWQRESAAAAM